MVYKVHYFTLKCVRKYKFKGVLGEKKKYSDYNNKFFFSSRQYKSKLEYGKFFFCTLTTS